VRPVRLELEGFSAYRQATEVDFADVDLFALTGPTGAGKTAILDAIAFALYGVVHRLGHKGAVAPAISQGLHEARVRLDFTVGEEAWTATRVVRRTKGGGASTAEARLVGPAGVVAGTAEEVTARVTELLGLTYDHFSRCVVLPQGEFARFLHDKASDRQELLVSLLQLDLYGRMAERAGRRAGEAKLEIARLDGRLAELSAATEDAVADAETRARSLRDLVGTLDDQLPVIAGLAADEDTARTEAASLAAEADRLAAVEVPGDVRGLTATLAAATATLDEAISAVERAELDEETSRAAVEARADRAEIVTLLRSFDEREAAAARREKGERVVAASRGDLAAAERAVAAATGELEAARRRADAVAAAHRAHAVRADAIPGEPCPVCAQLVEVLPDEPPPADLETAARAVGAAEQARTDDERARSAAAADLAKAEALLVTVSERIAELDAQLDGRNRAGLQAELAAVDTAAEALGVALAATKAARGAEKQARQEVATATAAVTAAKDRFDAARDQLAALGAPARLGERDLAAEWDALSGWAAAEEPGRRAAAAAATARVDELAATRTALLAALAERCAAAGVVVGRGEAPRDAAARAAATATANHEMLAQQRHDAVRIDGERTEVLARHEVARSLATHLDARHFEKWVLDEALRGLAAGATELLRTLSGGQYSLAVDGKGTFVVVDHRNADETRPARTLSGGETFLASLALALALADRIATLAAGGATRLDAIFLDEGFGTLDPDTLDVVATAIEELGAAGRMVGVVSHVAELAERVPVRFEVARSGPSSTITRVDR
jgi:exonuclease SbcC